MRLTPTRRWLLALGLLTSGLLLYRYTDLLIWEPAMIDCNELKTPQYPEPDPEAQAWFDRAYAMTEPLGQPIDFAEVARLYRLAVDKGHYKAMNNLAVLYLQGMGVEESESKALALYVEMQQYAIPEAHRAMAYVYEQGLSTAPRSRARALKELYKAAEYGDLSAISSLGTAKMFDPSRQALLEAIKLFECALQRGYGGAAKDLSLAYLFEKRHKDYYDTLIRGANLTDRSSISELETTFRMGNFGFPEDKKRSECFLAIWDATFDEKNFHLTEDIRTLCPANVPLPYGIKGG